MASKMQNAGEEQPSTGLGLFRLIPTVRRGDRRIARDALHGEIVVRATSPDDARELACAAEAANTPGASIAASPFRDPALYTVIAVPGAGFMRSGERGVIAGRFSAKATA